MNAETLILWALATLVSSFTGSYLGGYLKRKGENLATHEDLDKLVAQVSVVTQTTKDIEAKISTEVWDRQRRWELKRDVLFETARKAGREIQAVIALQSVFRPVETNAPEEVALERGRRQIEAITAWNIAAGDFEGMIMLVSASCGMELVRTLLQFGMFTRSLADKITDGKPEAFFVSSKELVSKSDAITVAIRKELEIPLTK